MGLAVLALSIPLAATAQAPDALQVTWNDDGSCARPALLESEITRLLGPDSRSKGELRFDVRVAQLASSADFALTLRVEAPDDRAEREVRLESCRDVQEAAALLIATAIDPTAVLRAAPAKASPPPEPEPEPPAEEPARAVRRMRWSLLGGATWDYQTLPRHTFGPLLGVLVDMPYARVSLDGRYLARRVLEYPRQELEIELDLFSAVVTAAYAFPLGRFVSLGPAVAAEVGVLRVRTSRRENQTQRPVWGDALAGAQLAVLPTERLGVEFGMWFGRPISPIQLALREREPFYTVKGWTCRATVALRVSLGPKE